MKLVIVFVHNVTKLLQISMHFTAAGPDLNLDGKVQGPFLPESCDTACSQCFTKDFIMWLCVSPQTFNEQRNSASATHVSLGWLAIMFRPKPTKIHLILAKLWPKTNWSLFGYSMDIQVSFCILAETPLCYAEVYVKAK